MDTRRWEYIPNSSAIARRRSDAAALKCQRIYELMYQAAASANHSCTLDEMAVSNGFEAFVIDQLERLGPTTPRRMFGAVGLYFDGYFFAVIDDDRLYFKVDDSNRSEYEEHGMGAFRPYGDERTMKYYEVPVDVLEDRDRLKEWAEKALVVARQNRRSR